MLLPTTKEVAGEAQPAIKHITTHLACFNCLPSESETKDLAAPEFLKQYATLSTGLAKFQKQMNIPQSGVFDVETAKFFNKPHCHNHDRAGTLLKGANHRDRKEITYCFNEYSAQLSVDVIRDSFMLAFISWGIHCPIPITFVEVAPHPGKGDIRIRWASRGGSDEHGLVFVDYHSQDDGNAKAPIEMYFDEDTEWTEAILRDTVIHQVGHILGLGHSEEQLAVMSPMYAHQPELHFEDIKAIRLRYPPPRKFEVEFGAKCQPGSHIRAWNLIFDRSNTAGRVEEIIAAAGGILYARDAHNLIWRYTATELWERIDSPARTCSLKVGSEYLYQMDLSSCIWRCRHSSKDWECVDSGGRSKSIASSHSCTDLYQLSKHGEILMLVDGEDKSSWKKLDQNEDNTSIKAISSKVYIARGRGEALVYNEGKNDWTRIWGPPKKQGREWFNNGQLFGDDDSLYKLQRHNSISEWKGGEMWTTLKKPDSDSAFSEFAVAKSHRYITTLTSDAILYNKRQGNEVGGPVEWVALQPPARVSQLAAIDDELYVLDSVGCIHHMHMG
ncbi:hypothetical protein TWF281_005775 [Arthrobotrys megalospora]